MKNIFIMVALAVSTTVMAAEVNVGRAVLGTGTPVYNAKGLENAVVVDNAKVENNILHVPQYLPYHPTAATIWPRVVEVKCIQGGAGLECESFNWTPAMGRAEYLFITPKVEAPQVVEKIVEKEVIVEKKVLVEVPPKKKRQ